jgi:ankyrin repeat protein/CHAT domain-containing protein
MRVMVASELARMSSVGTQLRARARRPPRRRPLLALGLLAAAFGSVLPCVYAQLPSPPPRQSTGAADQPTRQGVTALHLAAQRGDLSEARRLLRTGANVNATTGTGETPLFLAVVNQHVPVTAALLESGANPNLTDNGGRAPLHAAAAAGHAQLTSLLIAYGARIDAIEKSNGASPLHLAASTAGQVPVVRWLLDHGADVNLPTVQGTTPLHIAAEVGDADVARFLIGRGARLETKDTEGRTPLAVAAGADKTELVELLSEAGASADPVAKDGSTPLLVAARHGNEALARQLLDRGAGLEAQLGELGATPLLLAATTGNEALVRLLLDRGANLKARAAGGYSPLVLATYQGHLEVADLLIQRGVDVNAQSEEHQTAMYLAALNGYGSLVDELIRASADVNVRTKDGSTALMVAVGAHHIAVAERLIDAGAHETFESDPLATLLAELVRARTSGNNKRFEQVVLRSDLQALRLCSMYADEALDRRSRGEPGTPYLERAQAIATVLAEASGRDALVRLLQDYARMPANQLEARRTATATLQEAQTAFDQGQFDVAQRLGEKALQTFDKSDDSLSRLKVFVHLAWTNEKAGRLDAADLYVRKADQLLSQWGHATTDAESAVLGKDSHRTDTTASGPTDAQRFGFVVPEMSSPADMPNPAAGSASGAAGLVRASALTGAGKYSDALREYQALLEGKPAASEIVRGRAQLGAARAARALWQLGRADSLYGQAQRLLLRTGNKYGALAAQLELADLHSEIGRWEESVDEYSRALKTARALESIAWGAIIRSRLGNLFSLEGDPNQAIAYYQRALSDVHPGNPGGRDEMVLLMNIGTVYARAQKLKEALNYYQYVLDTALKNRDSTLEAQVRVNLALLQHGANNEPEAWKQIEAVNSLRGAIADPELAWRFERAGASILQARERPQEAATWYAEAVSKLEEIHARGGELDQAARSHVFERRRFVYREYVDVLVELASLQPNAGYEGRLFELSEQVKSRIFTELLAISTAAHRMAASPGTLETERVRELQLTRLQQDLVAALQEPQGSRDENEIESLRAKVQATEAEQAVAAARLSKITQGRATALMRPTSVADVRGALRGEEIIISYVLGIRTASALLVTKDGVHLVKLPTNADELAELAAGFRSGLEKVTDWQELEHFDPVGAYQLYQKILGPLEGYISKSSRIFVCGDELIYSIPLEALVDRPVTAEEFTRARDLVRHGAGDYLSEYAGLHYVLDSHVFRYLPSATVLVLLRERQGRETRPWKRNLIAFGDPVFREASAAVEELPTPVPVIQSGDTMSFTSVPKKPLKIADYASLDNLLDDLLTQSTLSVKHGDKTIVADIEGKALFNAIAWTPDVEGQFFRDELAKATGEQSLARLPETNEEVRRVADELGAAEADLFLRERASKANLHALDLHGTRYLLFATHGFLGGDFSGGAEPALALSQIGDSTPTDGFLTMSEIATLDLDSELVVLSACDTAGLGRKAVVGEGFAGLTRSFMTAGAGALLVSHWSVDSSAARDVVVTFFELSRSMPSAEALREAKLGIKHQTRHIGKSDGGLAMSQSHPFFWAPFVFVGDDTRER